MIHKEKIRYKYLRADDFWSYRIRCNCGLEFCGWTPKEAEYSFNKHIDSDKNAKTKQRKGK